MEEKLIEIMSTILERSVDKNSDKNNIDTWDSLNHIELIVTLEEEFNVTITPEEIPKLTSYKSILKKIKEQL